MPKKLECTCAEDDWLGARGHINLTMNGHWPLGEDDKYVECPQCSAVVGKRWVPRFVPRSYADGRKKAMNREPLYDTPAKWWAALNKGVGYNLTPTQVKAAARAEKKRAADQAKADVLQLEDNKRRGLA